MPALIFALLGFMNNMLRGGLHGSWKQKFFEVLGFELKDGKYRAKNWWQKAIDFLLDGDQLSLIILGLMIYFMAPTTNQLDKHLLAMWIGGMFGWGMYIGALGGWEDGIVKPLKEWEPIDQLIEDLKDRPVLWGLAGMTLRGAVWGFVVTLSTHSYWPLLAGLTMGVVYWASIKVVGRKYGWTAAEGVFGFIFYYAIAQALGI